MTDIGRAGIVMKGDYNSASTYETLDAVSYQNGLYIAKTNVPAGIVPTNTTYWQLAVADLGRWSTWVIPVPDADVAAQTWLNESFPVHAGDRVIWSVKSSSDTGAFTTTVEDSLGHVYSSGAVNHSDFSTPAPCWVGEIIQDAVLNITSYTNVPAKFSNIAITINSRY